MNVMVTGGAGFIGSHVADALIEQGHQVWVVDNLSSGREANIPRTARFEKIDICEAGCERLIANVRPEAIFHLAAQIDVRRSVADPVLDAQINVLGMIRVLSAAARAQTRQVIFSSTGGAIYGEQDVFPASEDHPNRPVSPYGTSKACGEAYLGYFSRSSGLQGTALRYSNVYGPRQDPHGEAGVVAIFCGLMLVGRQPTIFGDGGQTRDFVYVKDVAQANLLALERSPGGVINVGTGIETDVNELAGIIGRLAGYPGKSAYAPERPGEQRRSVIDPHKAAHLLGWQPTTSLEAGLAETVAYFRQTQGGPA